MCLTLKKFIRFVSFSIIFFTPLFASASSLPDTSTSTSAVAPSSLSDTIAPLSGGDRARYKTQAISALGAIPKTFHDGIYLEVTSQSANDGTLDVFARAWNANNEQIGFGDGTVDIEHFRIVNPPILVKDPNGTIVRTFTDPITQEVSYTTYREDLHEALLDVLAQTIRLKKATHDSTHIIPGHEGHTTTTIYPEAHTASTAGDWLSKRSTGSETFSAIRNGSGTGGDNDDPESPIAALFSNATTDRYTDSYLNVFVFNTAPIADTATVTSATISFYDRNITSCTYGFLANPGVAIDVTGATTSSNTAYTNSDYENTVGSPSYGSFMEGDLIGTSTYVNTALNSAGINHINLTGVTKFATQYDWLQSGTFTGTWSSGNCQRVYAYMADQSGTTNDPKLTIESDTPAPTGVVVGHSSTATITTTATTSTTWSHTATGDSMLLVEFALNPSGSAPTNVSCTYAGTAMTRDPYLNGVLNSAGYEQSYGFFLPYPTTGTNNVSCAWTNAATMAGGAVSFVNATALGNTLTASTTALRTSFSSTGRIGADDVVLGFTEISDKDLSISWTSPAEHEAGSSDLVQLFAGLGVSATGTIAGTHGLAYSRYAVTPVYKEATSTLVNGAISTSTTWTIDGSGVYLIDGAITVDSGVTLTIDPGVIVKFKTTSSSLGVNGNLVVHGATDTPVYFTSYKDDTVGWDTNHDGKSTSPSAADWNFVRVNAGGSATMTSAIIRYAGNSNGGEKSLATESGGTLTLSNVSIATGTTYGIYSYGTTTVKNSSDISGHTYGAALFAGALTVATSSIHHNSSYGVLGNNQLPVLSLLTLNGNTFWNNGYAVQLETGTEFTFSHSANTMGSSTSGKQGIVLAGALSTTTTFVADSIPYIVKSTAPLSIPSGVTMTLSAGSVVKMDGSIANIDVSGTMVAEGSSPYPLYFTSIKDDSVNGDTNGDLTGTSPGAGDWDTIKVESGKTATFNYAVIRYGGFNGCCWGTSKMLYNDGGTLIIASSTISNGVYGVYQSSGTTTISQSVIRDNTSYGLYVSSGATSTATNNYWGTTTTPYHPTYSTNAVSDKVEYNPWLGAEHYVSGTSTSYTSVHQNRIHWKWATSSSQSYATQLDAAIATWNELDPIDIIEATTSDVDLIIEEVLEPTEPWGGQTTIVFDETDLLELNKSKLINYVPQAQQKTPTHEIGHSLGLGHSYWDNVMYFASSTHYWLGDQDILDYHYLWPN